MAVTPIPVVCECLVVLCIQRPCSRKHDGGVQVGDDGDGGDDGDDGDGGDGDRKSTRLNSSHSGQSRMPSSA